MGNDIATSIVIQAQDQASPVLSGIGQAFAALQGGLSNITNTLVNFGQQSFQVASQYQQSMNMIQSLTGASTDAMTQYDSSIKGLAADTGVAATSLSGGLYNMISAGYSGSDAIKMLTLSTKDSVIGMTDATVTSQALSTVMRGFGVDIKYADSVNGEMIRTVTAGKMTMQDYAGAITRTSSTAVQYKDTMVDMNSVLATLTANGVKSAAIAGTDYDNLLKVLNGDTQKLSDKAKALNPAWNANGFAAMSVADKVKYLNTMIVEHGHQITDVMGRQMNAEAAFTILANNAKMYGDNLKNLGDTQANAMATDNAWNITQQGFTVTWNRLQASIQNVEIELGTVFLPILTRLLQFVQDTVSGFSDWITKTGVLQAAANALGAMLSNVWGVLGQLESGIFDLMDGMTANASTWGSNMMGGFINGIESMVGELVSLMNNVAQEVANFIGFASPSKKGPGRNLMSWGPSMIQAFAQGIVASGGSVQDAVNTVAQIASDGLQGVSAGQAGASAGSAAASGISSSSVSIGAGLQSVSLGMPFGQRGGSSSGSSATKANPLATALSTSSSSIAASTTKHAAAVAASTQKHAAAVAAALTKHQAALAKHAASVAAATQKHQAALAKHAATAAATAARHQAAMVKHAATVAAALKRHEDVLAREAANKAKSEARKAAKAAGKAGAGGTDQPTGGPTSALANGLQATQQFAQGITNGTGSVATAVNGVSSTVKNGFKGITSGVKPAIDGAIGAFKLALSSLIPIIRPTLQIAGQIFLGLWNTIKTLAVVIGTTLLPACANLVSAVAPLIANLLKWIASSGLVRIAFAALGIAITVVAATIGIIINVVSALIKFFTQTQVGIAILQAVLVILAAVGIAIGVIAVIILVSMIPAFMAWLGAAILVGIANIIAFAPIVLIVLAVIAVVAAVILVIKNWGAICTWAQGVWQAFLTWFQSAWGAMGAWFGGIWKGIQAGFAGIATWFKNLFSQAANGVKSGFSAIGSAAGSVGNQLQKGNSNIIKGYQDMATKSVDSMKWLYNHNYYVKDAVDATVSWTKSANSWLVNAWDVCAKGIGAAWQWLANGAVSLWNTVTTAIKTAVLWVVNWISVQWTTATNFVGVQWQKICTFASYYFGLIYTTVKGWIDKALAWIQQQLTLATKFISTEWGKLMVMAGVAWAQVSTVFSSIWTKYISQPLASLASSISAWFTSMGTTAMTSGRNFMIMLANGITSGTGWISNAVTGIANTIWKTLGFHSPPKEGPLRDSDKYMGRFLKMMGKDLDDGADDMKKSAKKVAAAIAGGLNNSAMTSAVAATIKTVAGVALPNYDQGTGQTVADRQPVVATPAPIAGRDMHIHVHLGDSDGDAQKHATKVADAVKKELAKQLRGQAITPRYTSGGTR